jgi:phosphoglycerate kinase
VESGGDVASAAAARDAVDIGPRTVELFVDKLREGGIAVMTGPMGVVEVEEYSRGTREVMRSMVQYSDFSVIGGGHTIMAARRFGLISKVNHVSTGGRAFLQFMGGEELPGLRALVISRRKFWVH